MSKLAPLAAALCRLHLDIAAIAGRPEVANLSGAPLTEEAEINLEFTRLVLGAVDHFAAAMLATTHSTSSPEQYISRSDAADDLYYDLSETIYDTYQRNAGTGR